MRATSGLRILLAAAITATPAIAGAQSAAPPPPPPRHETTAELAFVGVTGNASSNTFGLGFDTIARPERWTFRHRVAFVRNEADGALTAKSFLYVPRAEHAINARLGAFGEYQYFRDRFAGVSGRHAVTGGISAKLVASERQTLALDAGVGYLDENRLAGEEITSATYTVGGGYRLKLSDTADLSDDAAIVGTFDQSDDWRLVHAIALTAKVSTALSLKVSNGIRYSHLPAPGFRRTDAVTAIALVAKFTRP
jgi:putative salt-induced outer membrane protein